MNRSSHVFVPFENVLDRCRFCGNIESSHFSPSPIEAPRVEGELPPTGVDPHDYTMDTSEYWRRVVDARDKQLLASQAEVERLKERLADAQFDLGTVIYERNMLQSASKLKDETIATLRAEIAELKEP